MQIPQTHSLTRRLIEKEAKLVSLKAKETDIYKINQSDDLIGMDLSEKPALERLRTRFYSDEFTDYMKEITAFTFNVTAIDLSLNSYTEGIPRQLADFCRMPPFDP